MSQSTSIQHRLYLKQIEFFKLPAFAEVLPANFNYQNMIIVESGTVEKDGQLFVFQTYSCGCGPQPLIKAAFLLEEVAWKESEFHRLLAASGNQKDTALLDQNIFDSVLRIRPARTDEQKRLVEMVMRQHFSDNKRKISFF